MHCATAGRLAGTVVNVVYLPFEWPPGMHPIHAPGYRVPESQPRERE